jgi:hypothetical protein
MYGITDLEKRIWKALCAEDQPDMMIDYHSLGKSDATKYDRGDMEVIIPANSTKWGMDEQIYQHVAARMQEAAETAGWPYEIHTLEDLSFSTSSNGKCLMIPERPWPKWDTKEKRSRLTSPSACECGRTESTRWPSTGTMQILKPLPTIAPPISISP